MKNKIAPKLPKIETPFRPFYGSYITTCRDSRGKKTNMICPDTNCGYGSRVFINPFSEDKRDFMSSHHCPTHRLPLVNIGCANKVPKKGSKERKELIKKYKK